MKNKLISGAVLSFVLSASAFAGLPYEIVRTTTGDSRSVCTYAKNLARDAALSSCDRVGMTLGEWFPEVTHKDCRPHTACTCTVAVAYDCDDRE